jgi:integrase
MAKTVYKKKFKNGTEYYFFRLRHKNLPKPKDLYATTVKELEQKIKSLIHELDNNIVSNKEYFGAFFEDWMYNTHLTNKKPSTKERYDSIFRNYIKDSTIYSIKLKDLAPSHIQSYYNTLISNGKTIAAVNNLHKLVAPCIRYAYDSNRLIKDFSRAIVLPTEKEAKKLTKISKVNPFSLDEQFKFIEEVDGNENEMLYITALDSGLRQGELFALTWDDIDFENKYIYVNKSFKSIKNIGSGEYEELVQTPKTGTSTRTVPIPDHLASKLKLHRLNQKAIKLKMGNLYIDNKLVFCNIYGGYLDSSNIRKRLKRLLSKIGLEDRKFHDLRHTYATRLFELGEEAKTVQKLLGHSSISITLDTYTHVLDRLKKRAASKLDSLYSSKGAN